MVIIFKNHYHQYLFDIQNLHLDYFDMLKHIFQLSNWTIYLYLDYFHKLKLLFKLSF